MDDSPIPVQVIELAEERAQARAARDFARADELKARIEGAGWRVVDDGPAFTLHPARAADVIEDGQTIYGSIESVPLRDGPSPPPRASLVILAGATDPGPALRTAASHRPAETEIVLVAPRATDLPTEADVVVRTLEPWTAGDALEAGVRSAGGEIVVVLAPERVPTGDVVGRLVEALADPAVAVVAADGLTSTDLHRYRTVDAADVTTVASGCYAFRRADLLARGPVDGRLRTDGGVATWLGLVLRDEGPDHAPRRALRLDLPLAPAPEQAPDQQQARAARRDAYRTSDRFRERTWLRAAEPPEGHLVGDGAEHDHGRQDADEADHTGQP